VADSRSTNETVELALADLLRVVLTPDQHTLIAALDAIADARVRAAIVAVACAAAGFDQIEDESPGDPSRRVPDAHAICLARVRQHLRTKKGGWIHEGG
jgi:hypothetical protein